MKPTLYYYQHCPFCVRVLTLAGLAGIELDKKILLNDDEQTPIAMTGVKSLPILATAPKQFMGESLDIIDYLCKQSGFVLEKNVDDVKIVTEFLQTNRLLIYGLAMPRWVQMPFEEFSTDKAVTYFTKKKTQTIGNFKEAIQKTAEWSRELENILAARSALFDQLVKKPNSLASIMLFSALIGVTSVRGFIWPPSAEHFMQTMSRLAKVDLLTDKAV